MSSNVSHPDFVKPTKSRPSASSIALVIVAAPFAAILAGHALVWLWAMVLEMAQ